MGRLVRGAGRGLADLGRRPGHGGVRRADQQHVFDGIGPVRLQLIGSTTFPSGVVRLAYRPAAGARDPTG